MVFNNTYQAMLYYSCRSLMMPSVDESAAILGTLIYLHDKEYQCNNPKKFRSQMQYQAHRHAFGCDRIIDNEEEFIRVEDSSLMFRTCFCNFFDPQVSTLINLAKHYEEYGQLSPQIVGKDFIVSAKLLNVINIINNFINAKKAEDMQKHHNDMKAKYGG